MRYFKFVYLAALLCCTISNAAFEQDIIVDGIVLEEGTKDCLVRYKTIKKILKNYERPFTVLNLDAQCGYYSFSIARDFPATCIMVEEKNAAPLLELCELNNSLQSLILLNKDLSHQELERLSECEHFDVILALDVLNTSTHNWQEIIDTVLQMGDHIFIEFQEHKDHHSDYKEQMDYLTKQGGTILAHLPRTKKSHRTNILMHFSRSKTILRRKYWTYKRYARDDDFVISSNFTTKKMHKKKGNQIIDWHPGINLLTFKNLNGIYPRKEIIREKLLAFKHIKHTDLHIWNVIIQGNTLIPIDGDDRKLHYNPKYTVQKIMDQFRKRLHNLLEIFS